MINEKKEKLIRKLYKLNPTEYRVFMTLIESIGRTPLSVKELIGKIGSKDRTTIQKSLTSLLRRDLIDKEQVNLDRGFMFVYSSMPKSQLIRDLRIKVHEEYDEENAQITLLKNVWGVQEDRGKIK